MTLFLFGLCVPPLVVLQQSLYSMIMMTMIMMMMMMSSPVSARLTGHVISDIGVEALIRALTGLPALTSVE